MPPPSDLRVLIIGAGLAGLIMGIMLEKAGIDFLILEQASRLRPLGTSITLHPVIIDLVDQLGLLEEMFALSKPLRGITVLTSKGQRLGRIDTRSNKQKYVVVAQSMEAGSMLQHPCADQSLPLFPFFSD